MLLPLLASLASAVWTPLPSVGEPELNTLHAFGDTLVTCGRGGCARTSDLGSTWEVHHGASVVSPSPIRSGSLMLATDRTEPRTLRLSRDGGRSWIDWNQGIARDQGIAGLAFSQGLAFLASRKANSSPSVFQWSDTCSWYIRDLSSSSWTLLETRRSPRDGDACRIVALTPERTLHRLRGRDDSTGGVSEVSTDLGATWQEEDDTPSSRYPGVLAIRSAKAVSLDTGATFVPLLDMHPVWSFLDGAYHSADSLSPWKDIRTGVPRNIRTDSIGFILDWCRTGRGLWSLTKKGLFLSVDSGATWTPRIGPVALATNPVLSSRDGDLFTVGRHGENSRLWTRASGTTAWAPVGPVRFWYDKPRRCGPDLLIPYQTESPYVTSDVRVGLVQLATNGSLSDRPLTRIPLIASTGDDWATWGDSGLTRHFPGGTETFVPATNPPSSFALSRSGVFTANSDWYTNLQAGFLPNDSLASRPLAILASLEALSLESGSPRAWIGTHVGLFSCLDATDCRRVRIADTDTLAQIRRVRASGPLVAALVVPIDAMGDPLYASARFLASRDTGRTWKDLAPPGYVLDAAFTTEGIAVSLSGRGVWLLADPEFASTSVGPRPIRAAGPALSARGRILSFTDVAPGTVVQVLDASGRTLRQAPLDVRDGTATLEMPASIRGVLMVRLRSEKGAHVLRTVVAGR